MEEAGKEPEQKLFFMTAAPALPRKRYFRKKKCIQTRWHHFPPQRCDDITGANVSNAKTHSSFYIQKDLLGNLLGSGALFLQQLSHSSGRGS